MHSSAILVLAITASALQVASSGQSPKLLWPVRGGNQQTSATKVAAAVHEKNFQRNDDHRDRITFLRELLRFYGDPEVQRINDLVAAAQAEGIPPNADALKHLETLIAKYLSAWDFSPTFARNAQKVFRPSDKVSSYASAQLNGPQQKKRKVSNTKETSTKSLCGVT